MLNKHPSQPSRISTSPPSISKIEELQEKPFPIAILFITF